MKTFFKVAGGSIALFGVYLYSHNETPSEFAARVKTTFKSKQRAYAELQAAYHDLKSSAADLKAQLPTLEKAAADLQRDFDQAMFQIQPRLDEINKYGSKLNKS